MLVHGTKRSPSYLHSAILFHLHNTKPYQLYTSTCTHRVFTTPLPFNPFAIPTMPFSVKSAWTCVHACVCLYVCMSVCMRVSVRVYACVCAYGSITIFSSFRERVLITILDIKPCLPHGRPPCCNSPAWQSCCPGEVCRKTWLRSTIIFIVSNY